ncbi:helix-turn-helix transcriptional regulator [Candidatus Poribacteria bacterium]|nr:helix-turn-helix transcriptional regulator [Candidatus Poribacteria bacterium]
MSPDTSPPPVGQILAEKRSQRGLSLQSLAKISGVSKSMISQIENGQVNPTLAVVWKIASGLGLKLQDLLEGEMQVPDSRYSYLTDENCPTLTSKEHGYRIQILSTIDMVQQVELYLIEIKAGGGMESEPHAKGTVETLTAVRGEVEVILPGETVLPLEPFNSVRYHADVPHSIRAKGGKPALAYLAVKFEWSARG